MDALIATAKSVAAVLIVTAIAVGAMVLDRWIRARRAARRAAEQRAMTKSLGDHDREAK